MKLTKLKIFYDGKAISFSPETLISSFPVCVPHTATPITVHIHQQ